jgi:hypothetical protein
MKHPWFFPAGNYIGQMKNGLAHGKGTYTSSFKGKKKGKTYKYYYKGDFVNGERHGKAKQIIHLPKYTIKYEGSFKNDLSDGHGVLTMISKGKLEQKYIGEFKKGYRHGKGKLIDYFEKWTKQGRFVKGGFKK